jgi:arylsulfatase
MLRQASYALILALSASIQSRAETSCIDFARLAHSTVGITRYFDDAERTADLLGIQGTGWFQSSTSIVTVEHVVAAMGLSNGHWKILTIQDAAETHSIPVRIQRVLGAGPERLAVLELQTAISSARSVDEVLVKASSDFMDKAKRDGKPFFVWHNTTRMHVWTFLSDKYKAMQNSQTNYGLEEAGMAQLDDSVGALLKKIDDMGETNNTIVIFTTDNGAEVFTWPDGGMTPFKNTKGTVGEGGFRVPAIIRWPGQVKPGTVENGLISGLDWFPTLMAAAGNPNITDQLLRGVQLGDRTYKNHLDGYNQMDLLTGKGPSKRHEIFYFGGANLGALRLDDFKFTFYQQPYGWPGEKTTTDMPGMVNIRQDPFERTPSTRGESPNTGSFGYGNDFFAREFWRFVMVQQYVGKLAQTAINFPPMQDPASFNLEAVKKKVEEMVKNRPGQ